MIRLLQSTVGELLIFSDGFAEVRTNMQAKESERD